MMRYTVIYEKGPTSWGAYVPDLPGVISVGDSRDEVERLIHEAIEIRRSRTWRGRRRAPPLFHPTCSPDRVAQRVQPKQSGKQSQPVDPAQLARSGVVVRPRTPHSVRCCRRRPCSGRGLWAGTLAGTVGTLSAGAEMRAAFPMFFTSRYGRSLSHRTMDGRWPTSQADPDRHSHIGDLSLCGIRSGVSRSAHVASGIGVYPNRVRTKRDCDSDTMASERSQIGICEGSHQRIVWPEQRRECAQRQNMLPEKMLSTSCHDHRQ